MSEIRVRIFFNKHNTVKRISGVYNLIDNKYKRITFVDDNSYTHAIIINNSMPRMLRLPKRNVLGLAYEPNELMKYKQDKIFMKYLEDRVGKYFMGKPIKRLTPRLGRILTVHYSFMDCNNKFLLENKIIEKKYPISIIASTKTFLPGHRYRHKLIRELLKTRMDIHMYGNNLGSKHKDQRIKGTFRKKEPYEDYQFTIAIENTCSDLYISEKYMNPIAYKCIPIYLGASKIESIFGKDCCIKLTGELEKDVLIISNIYNNPEKYVISLENAKKEILGGKAHLPEFLNNYW